MQFWVGITDGDWFKQLSAMKPDEVNFWQPHARKPALMDPGTPFLFKLKSPVSKIAGGAFFVRFSVLPCQLAWEAFREKNGARSQVELSHRIGRLRREEARPSTTIGCNVLAEPFFFPPEKWIDPPSDWSPNIVVGKRYDSASEPGAALWTDVLARLGRIREEEMNTDALYGADYLFRTRLGQDAFRVLVTDAYHRRCAVTGEKTLPALEAAHIKAYNQSGPHRIDNGLLLRADIHRLFDDGYVTVDPSLHFVVSRRVREEFENGREYYRFHGVRVQNLPETISQQPNREFLEWHNQHCFVE